MRPIDQMRDLLVRWYGKDAAIAQLDKAQHYDITNVAEYAEQFGGKKLSELEFAVPPWDFVYAEWSGTQTWIFIAQTQRSQDDCKAWEIKLHISDGRSLTFRGTISMGVTGTVRETANWETRSWGEWVEAEHFDRPAVEAFADLRKKVDELKRRRPDKAAAIEQSVMGLLDNDKHLFTAEERKMFGKVIPDEFAMVFFLATMLANCKNVESEAILVPPKLIRAQQKRNRVPIFRWYRLKIDPMRKVIKNQTDGGELTYERAFHICRGHFKTFTDARPLFGRVTGRFWWPMHTRGNKEMGTVDKTYEIAAHT